MGLLIIVQVIYMSMENHVEMTSTGKNSLFFHQSSLAIQPTESSTGNQDELGEGNEFYLL
jgi:hypothetical protein